MSVIKRSDLITDEAFNWPKQYQKDLEGIITTSKKLGQGGAKKNIDELSKVQRQLSVATERSSKEFIEQKAALNTLNTTTRNAVKDVQNLDNAYDKLSKELNDARKSFKNLAAAGKENTKAAKAQLATIKRLDGQLKKIDNTVGQNQRSVGKYSDALKGVTARFLGWAAVATVLFKALQSGIKIVLEYSKSNSRLNAVLNKSSKETKELRKQQIELGKSTAFTSTEVTKAQIELAKLGKTQQEIIDLTPAILNAAVVFGSELAPAAELVAGQLNAFNLAAAEGGRISDALARATQISSLDFDRLRNSLDKVGKVSNISNVSFEKTLATLGAVTDTNIAAEKAGTAFRNILLESAKAGKPYEELLREIENSSNKAKTATELFGKQNAAVAIVIAESTEKINKNTIALDNAAGSAKKFADEVLDNLVGEIILLTSAWEGFITAIETGDGVIAKVVRGSLQGLRGILTLITDVLSDTDIEFERFKKNIKESNPSLVSITGTISRLTNSLQIQKDILEKINTQEGIFIDRSLQSKKVTDEKIANLSREIKFLKELQTEAIKQADIQKKLDEEAAAAKLKAQQEANKKIAEEQAKLNALLHDLDRQGTEDTKSEFLKEVEAKQESNDRIKRIEEDLAGQLKAIGKRTTAANKAAADERVRIAEEEAAEKAKIEAEAELLKQQIIDQSFALASETANRFTDLRIQQIGQELTAIEFARDRELELAGDNERQKLEINRKFDEQRKQLQRKQAVAEKQNAVFQIALNTAIGIVNAASKVVTIPLIPFIAAIGAVQAAAVLAAPIPTFDEGSEATPKDYIAGEKRPELRKSKGKWSLVDKPTLFKDSPGDKIVSGKETDSILGNITDLTRHNILTDKGSILSLLNNDIKIEKRKDSNIAYILERNNADLIRTIKNKKETSIAVKNAKVTERSSGRVVHIFNHYYVR